MDRLQKLLDNAKVRIHARTDSDLARHLKLSRSAVSLWRQAKAFPDPVACGQLAELNEIPLAQVLGMVGELRAKTDAERRVWRRLAANAAAVVALLTGVGATTLPAPALAASGELSGGTGYTLCEVLRRLRWLFRFGDRRWPTLQPC